MTEVLSARSGAPSFPQPSLRSSTSQSSIFGSNSPFSSSLRSSVSFSDLQSHSANSSLASSTFSTPASSLSFDTNCDDSSSSDDEGMVLPDYNSSRLFKNDERTHETPPSSPVQVMAPPTPSPIEGPRTDSEQPAHSEDDTAVRLHPSQHVDYLSHEWEEEDIWSSWRHIVEHRKEYGERSRLENASWRTWAKTQFKLKTTSPDSLNWLKDVDVTWLYGPLQPASHRSFSQHASEPVSRLSKTNSFLNKKPILKKRSMSEVMLAKSISSSSLVKQAASAVQAQQIGGDTLAPRRQRPIIGRATSDFATLFPSRTISRDTPAFLSSHSTSTSGLQTPDQSEKKHIRFDEKVEQCIAVECKGADEDDEEDFNQNPWAKYREDDSSSDEGVVMMKKSRRKRPLSRTNSRSSFSAESKTIAKLPSTTLKYRTDSPDLAEQHPTHSLGYWRSSRLSPSPSQETLRPSNPSTNFLLPDDDEDNHFTFNAAGVHERKRASTPAPSESSEGGLRRTASGMFMPFEDEDENPAPPGIIGRVVDTVNTARDIAHVIWNVGWRN